MKPELSTRNSDEHGAQRHCLTKGHWSHISVWFDLVSDLTVDTCFLAISREQARALQKATEYTRLDAHHRATEQNQADILDPLGMLKDSELANLNILIAELDRAMADLQQRRDQKCSGFFVRLDTRSPKDAVFLLPRVRQILEATVPLRSFRNPWSSDAQTYDAACVNQAIIAAQRVSTGREAVDLLRHSQRVEADLVMGQVANAGGSGDLSSHLVVRRWEYRIDPNYEVRVFVYAGRVTGITQYNSSCLMPLLRDHVQEVAQLICAAVERPGGVHDRIHHILTADPDPSLGGETFYVIDFALITNCDTSSSVPFEQALLIEINPAPPVAGTILFNWQDKQDRVILTTHRNPEDLPCVRVVKKPIAWRDTPFHPPLKAHVDALRHRRSRWPFSRRSV